MEITLYDVIRACLEPANIAPIVSEVAANPRLQDKLVHLKGLLLEGTYRHVVARALEGKLSFVEIVQKLKYERECVYHRSPKAGSDSPLYRDMLAELKGVMPIPLSFNCGYVNEEESPFFRALGNGILMLVIPLISMGISYLFIPHESVNMTAREVLAMIIGIPFVAGVLTTVGLTTFWHRMRRRIFTDSESMLKEARFIDGVLDRLRTPDKSKEPDVA